MKFRPLSFVLLIAIFTLGLSLSAGRSPVSAQSDNRGITANPPASSEHRVALVIGNNAYSDSPLLNPVNDARAMSQALRRFGFELVYGENLSLTDMKRNIRTFGEKIRNGGVGLFYYAGHGVQVNGRNYLIPVSATITKEEEVEYEAVDVSMVLTQMENARNRLNLIILDACRNNPFARSFRSAKSGLASINAPSGTLIAYATAPGSVASDGVGKNGLYTQELLNYLSNSELNIEQVFKQVRIAVREQTQGKQVPWESSSLVGEFYFALADRATGATSTPPPPVDPVTIELSFWNSIKGSADPEDYKAYLEKYPAGTFIALAKNKIRSLEAKAKPSNDNKAAGDEKALKANDRASEPDPKSAQDYYQSGKVYFENRQFREAAIAARRAYDANNQSNDYGFLLAKSLLSIGQTQEAIEIFKRMVAATTPNSADQLGILPHYAEALVFGGQYDEATKILTPLLKSFRKDSPAHFEIVRISADALRRSGKRNDAVKLLSDTVKDQDAGNVLALIYSLAETYAELRQFDKAISTYEKALNAVVNRDGTVKNNPQGQFAAQLILQRIGLAYRLAGNRNKAMETFEKMRKVLSPDNSLADQLIIDTLINEGKYKEALDATTSAMARFPGDRGLKFQRAQVAGKLGDMRMVDDTLRGLLKQSPEDADIYLYWASVQQEANMLKEAEENARKAINFEPNNVGPLITLSSIQQKQQKYKESEAALRRAIEIDPDNPTVLNNLGYFLAERKERLSEAEALIRRAVNIEPTNGSFLDSLGWLLFQQGKLQESQRYVEQAAIYSPQMASIHDHLGDIYSKQGQVDQARQSWEEALRLASGEEAEMIRKKLGK